MVIQFKQFTNTEDRRSSFMKNFRRPKIFGREKFPNTEDRIVLFGPNYSRIPKNRSIRCNSDRLNTDVMVLFLIGGGYQVNDQYCPATGRARAFRNGITLDGLPKNKGLRVYFVKLENFWKKY